MSQSKVWMVVLFFVLLVKDNKSFYWPCENSTDCIAEDSVCSEKSYACECREFPSVFSEDFSKCLKTSLFGDKCEETVQCNLMPSGANCKSGVCDCADGHTYVRGRCTQLNGLDQICESDIDCYFGYDRESVKCQDRVCQCADGYYRRHGNICRRKSMEIGDACVVNTDCDELGKHVECKDLKCQTVNLETTTTSKTTTKKPEIETTATTSLTTDSEKTTTTVDISSTQTTTTTDHTSSSVTPSTTTETISTDSSSIDIGLVEVSSPATDASSTDVNSDYTTRALNSQEHLVLVNGETSDSTDENEEQLLSEIEVKRQVSKETQFDNRSRIKSREIAVQTSIDAFELKDLTRKFKNVGTATTSTSTSSRHTFNKRRHHRPYRYEDDDIKTFSTLSNTDDDADERKFGSSCAENGKSCSGLPHSICSNNICFCKPGYYPKNGKCFAELGEIAESEDECEFEFHVATKKCICQKNFFYERNLRGCRKPIQYHLACTGNNQCSPFGAAFCHPAIPRRCTCDQFADYDAFQQMCVYKTGLGAECNSNEGCLIENSICSNGACACKDKYIEHDGACYKGIGADCNDDEECLVENTICDGITSGHDTGDEDSKAKSCQCRKGFVHFKDECLKEAEEIDDVCIENEQCEPLLASCVNKECKCHEGEHFKNGVCTIKKGLGETCNKATECSIEKDPENVECRNSVCQCKFGYQADSEQRTCIRVMPNKKNSSGRPSALKIITFALIGSAFLITSAAIKQAYFF